MKSLRTKRSLSNFNGDTHFMISASPLSAYPVIHTIPDAMALPALSLFLPDRHFRVKQNERDITLAENAGTYSGWRYRLRVCPGENRDPDRSLL